MNKDKIYIIFLFFLFIGCTSNETYFDYNSQCLLSCSDKGIRNLDISNELNSIIYEIRWEEVNLSSPNKVDFRNIEKGYRIYKYNSWKRHLISNKDFKLSPLTKYKIDRFQGDAASYDIEVSTNEKGEIVKSSKVSCN